MTEHRSNPSLRTKFGFGSYDFSNSGYVLIFQSFLFPLVFVDAAKGQTANPQSLWAIAVAISTLIAIIASPFVGLAADNRGRVRLFTALVLMTGACAMASGYIVGHDYLIGLLWFVMFNAAFELTQTLYDSFLKDIAFVSDDTTNISTFAWGFGYVGGATVAVLYLLLERTATPRAVMLTMFAFLFIVLSIPSLKFFGAHAIEPMTHRSESTARKTFPASPVSVGALMVYWIIAEAVGSVAYFAPMFARSEIGISERTIGFLLLATQIVAFPMTVMSARVAAYIGQRKAIQLCLVVWLLALIALFFAQTITHIIGIMFLVATVIGSTQALLRAHYASQVSREAPSEGFGFYAVAQKSAAVLGPALVAAVAWFSGTLRPTFLVLAVLVLVALGAARYLPAERVIKG